MVPMDYILDGFAVALQLLTTGDAEMLAAVYATLSSSLLAMGGCLGIGVPLGFLLGYCTFPGRRIARLLVDTALCFPTVVIGLLVYLLLSRRGPLGDLGLLFTVPGMALGLGLLGLPIIMALTALAVEQADRRLRMTLLTLGAGPLQVLWATVCEVRFHLMLAAITAFGRVVSEVGISMMVGGNIKWHTRTITTAIALETGKGDFALGIALGLVLLGIALAVNILLALLRKRTAA